MDKILGLLNSFTAKFKKPVTPINKYLLLTGSNNKSGLSYTEIATEIIARQEQLGIPTSIEPDNNIGDTGLSPQQAMYVIIAEVIVKHFIENAKIEIAVAPNIPIIAEGANSGGPVVVQGRTVDVAKGIGVIH